MELLGGGRTSRFQRALVEEQGVAVSAYAFSSSDSIATGMIGVGATPASGVSLETVEAALETELAAFLAEGPSEDALERAKSNIAAAAIYARDSQTAMANWFGASLVQGMSIDDIVGWEARIRAVTRDDVMRVTDTYLNGQNHVSARLLPGETG
ncbi:MAG: insulinase family protein, partial [Pseudomonadota bacterium]